MEYWSVGVLECWFESPDQDFVPKGLKDSAWGLTPGADLKKFPP
jgi:hypothetical protein